ncbi:MAG: hypothetical protein IJM59_07015 [Proteobacteria bacterium]|nr:hypothetical protein [Pseudomonadota bacterium]
MIKSSPLVYSVMFALCIACDHSSVEAERIDIPSPLDDYIKSYNAVYMSKDSVQDCYYSSRIIAFRDMKCDADIIKNASKGIITISLSRSDDGVYTINSNDYQDVLNASVTFDSNGEAKYRAVSGTVTIKDSAAVIDAEVNTFAPYYQICTSGACECFVREGDGPVQCENIEMDNPYHLKLTLKYERCEHLDSPIPVDLQSCP